MLPASRSLRRLLMILSMLLPAAISAAQPSQAMELSDRLYRSVLEAGFSPGKQFLAGDDGTQFPYSVVVTLPAGTGQAEKKENPGLVLSVPQEMAEAMQDELLSMLEGLSGKNLPSAVTLLLSACDFSQLPGRHSGGAAYGTDAFIEGTGYGENAAAVLLAPQRPGGDGKPEVVFGTDGRMTPQWFLRQIPLEISQSSLLTYRLNLSEPDERMAAFMDEGLAAVTVRLDAQDGENAAAVCAALEKLASGFRADGDARTESGNYLFISAPNGRKLWVGERLFILIYLAAAAAAIFFASGFSLLRGKRTAKESELSRTWFLIPATVLLSSLSLSAGQLIAESLPAALPRSPMLVLSVKTFLSFLIVSVMFMLLARLNLPLSQVVYGFLLTLVSVMNIFIFTSIDLILLSVFIFEYIIIYFTRLVRRAVPLFISTLLMLVPFVPYAVNIREFAAPQRLMSLVSTDFMGNILYACILVPFQIMWLRIFVRMNVFGKSRNFPPARIYGAAVIMLLVLLGVITAGFAVLSVAFSRGRPRMPDAEALRFNQPVRVYQEESASPLPVTVRAEMTDFPDTRLVRLTVRSALPVLKYDVTVASGSRSPVYDSPAPFELLQDGEETRAVFSLPYNPAGTTVLTYISGAEDAQEITVRMFVQTDADTAEEVLRRTRVPAPGQGAEQE